MTTAPSSMACTLTDVACDHCGLHVPDGLVEPGAEHQFCCQGCRTVFGIVHSGGLDSYYDMRRSVERDRAPAATSHRRYEEVDDPAYLDAFAQGETNGLMRTSFHLEGVHCVACVWLVERLSRVVPGVVESRLDFRRSVVTVRWDPARVALSAVARGLDRLGYPAHPPTGEAGERTTRLATRRELVRVGVAGAIAGNVMLLAIALYAGVFEGIQDEHRTLFRWYSAGLGVLSLAWPGRVFFKGAIAALRTRSAHLDLPIALALFVGGAWGVVNVIRGEGEIYFDSLAMLVFLLLVGRFFQSQQQRRATDAVGLMAALMPGVFRAIMPDGTVTERPIQAARVGDLAEVRAGDVIPVDGTVESGRTDVDESVLTGESVPVARAAGDAVAAGSVNLTGVIRVTIEATGEQTRAGRIMRLVGDEASRKSPVVRAADRLAGRFVIVVSALALITLTVWAFLDPAHAVDHATALLIVACPCALGLATPLVMTASIGRLARRGILVKGGGVLELLARPGRVWFDKTGTLTHGRLAVHEWFGAANAKPLAAALEHGSNHPVAQAIVRSLGDAECPRADDIEHIGGAGLAGSVNGRRVVVGNLAMMEAASVEVDEALAGWSDAQANAGRTPVLIAVDGRASAGISLADELRAEAKGVVSRFVSRGWRVGLLSGDRPEIVYRVAHAVGIEPDAALGAVDPEGKRSIVHGSARRGESGQPREPAVMVGDGVNDAAALAAADVGIAVRGGAEASLEAADVYIKEDGLGSTTTLLNAAVWTRRRLRACMAASLTYNGVAATLAMAGLVHPLLAAVLMPLSSLTVITLAAAGPRGGFDGVAIKNESAADRTAKGVPCPSS